MFFCQVVISLPWTLYSWEASRTHILLAKAFSYFKTTTSNILHIVKHIIATNTSNSKDTQTYIGPVYYHYSHIRIYKRMSQTSFSLYFYD